MKREFLSITGKKQMARAPPRRWPAGGGDANEIRGEKLRPRPATVLAQWRCGAVPPPDFSSPSLSRQEFAAPLGEEGKTANKERRNRERGPVEADSGCGGRTRELSGSARSGVHRHTVGR
ncbi:hypothetical protein MTO96_009877 [Rhipicephalus appendiculatus]